MNDLSPTVDKFKASFLDRARMRAYFLVPSRTPKIANRRNNSLASNDNGAFLKGKKVDDGFVEALLKIRIC